MAANEESLRRLALQDEQCIQSVLGIALSDHKTAGLDPKAHALVRLAALIALGASCVSYGWAVDAALGAGATADEIVGTLIAVAPITGLAQVVAATPAVARSLGYDLDWAFEVGLGHGGTRAGTGRAAELASEAARAEGVSPLPATDRHRRPPWSWAGRRWPSCITNLGDDPVGR